MDLPWQVEMLGGLRARRGPVLVTRWATNRAAALLARLCLFCHCAHPREELIDLLWPDADIDAGRNRLRVAVASLRRQLEPPGTVSGTVLIADRHSVRLNPVACRSDVAEFEDALKAAARTRNTPAERELLERVLSLFQGELLPGFYDDWIVDERERLNALHEDALRRRDALPAAASAAVAPALPEDNAPQTLRGFPLQFTRFFGREHERSTAVAALVDSETRLVTLTGPGGVGKTRLAVEVARQAASAFQGPVFWVSLADLAQAALVPDAIAFALGLTRAPDMEPLTQVVSALSAQPPALLVLDNFEHLVEEGVPLLFSLLTRVPHLTSLVTSRRRLGLAGEREQPVTPLRLPDAQETLEQLAHTDSVRLFVDRAQAARPDFQVTSANAAPIAQLCHTLEGLPLAIELVAARAQAFSPAQMNERLSARFALPEAARVGRMQGRHKSLWAAMAYSYDLLPPPLQRFFAALSVFRGGCTPEAAAAVCREPGALECLTQLRERSLLLMEDGPTGARFRLLETLREYALERLQEMGGESPARTRHRDFFLALAEDAEPKLLGADAAAYLVLLGAEQNNLRSALAGCLEGKDAETAQMGLRLVGALGRLWQARGELVEGREHLRAALSRAGADTPTLARAWALRWAGMLANFQGDFAAAQTVCAEALAIFSSLGEERGSGWIQVLLGNAAAQQGEFSVARPHFEEALSCFRTAEDAYGVGVVLNNLGSMLADQGEFADARLLYEEALARLRAAGNKLSSAVMLSNLGIVAYAQDRLAEARQYLEESLALRSEMGNRSDQSGYALATLAEVALGEGSTPEAWTHLREGLTACRENGDRPIGSHLLEVAGRVHLAEGQTQQAVRLLSAAARLREELGLPHTKINKGQVAADVAAAQAALSSEVFEACWAAGQALAWEEAIEEVFEGSNARTMNAV